MPLPPFLPGKAAPYPVLLDAYPYPAFIVRTNATLRPVWANRAFHAAFDVAGIQLADCFVHALVTADDGEHYGFWSAAGEEQSRTRTSRKRARAEVGEDAETSVTVATVTVRIRMASGEALLQLVKSRLEDLLIITSTVESAPESSTRDVSPIPPKRVRDANFAGALAPLAPLRLDLNRPLLTPEITPLLQTPQSPFSSLPSLGGSNYSCVAHTIGAVESAPPPQQHSYFWNPTRGRPLLSVRAQADVSTHGKLTSSSDDSSHDTFPQTALWWGPEYVLLYNDAYSQVIGHKHPYLYGQRASGGWAELWDTLGPRMKSLMAGQALSKTDDLMFFHSLTAAKLPMETYHSWVWVPCADESGKVLGVLNYSIDTTPKVIATRRMDCLRELGSSAMRSANRTEYYQAALTTLEQYPHELNSAPFAMFYSITLEPPSQDSGSAQDQSSIGSSTDGNSSPRMVAVSAQRCGLLGIPEDHPTAPNSITFSILTKRNSPSPRFFFGPSAVDIPAQALAGTEKRGWGEHARQALVIPIIAGSGGVEVGYGMGTCKLVLILGVNSRRPYDSDYEGWIDVLGSSLGQIYAGVTAREADFLRAEQLAQLDAAKTHFFSNASHELRTPLTLIAGPINDALGESTSPRVQEQLKLATRNVNRLRKLVDTLMDFSRVEAGRLEGHFRPVNLGSITADLAALFRSTIEKSAIQFYVECDVESKQLTYVDPELWEKIIFNLVGNAFKYTLSGRITVSIKYTDGFAVFSVSDTGVGIPPQDRSKICERFHRVASVSRSHEGTGIGLALTKELVRLHGGTLSVISQTAEDSPNGDHGSTFAVRIPLGRAHLPDSHVHDEQVEHVSSYFGRDWSYARTFVEEVTQWTAQSDSTPQTPSEGPESLPSLQGARVDPAIYFAKTDKILIVDDNSDMRTYMRQIFSRFCTLTAVWNHWILAYLAFGPNAVTFQVLTAKNGAEALEIAKAEVPNLILSDVMMPGTDGLQLIAALRSLSETSLIPVILVTAQAGVEGRVEGLLSGADDVVCKPFQSRELLARANLHTQLGKRRVELETKFNERTEELKIVTECSPVAFFRINSDREVVFANAKYYELTGQIRDLGSLDWTSSCSIQSTYLQEAINLWERAQYERKGGSINLQCNNGVWVKAQVVPTSLGIIGTLTDISAQKLYEESQLAHAQEREMLAKRRAEEADERRRAQELLIDVTSHELRQPVSAILNSAQLIRSNLVDLREAMRANDGQLIDRKLVAALEDDIESLDAVMQCGLAQERIANDVLSLSRIQLQVLAIHPTEFVLVDEVQNIVSIFKNETKMKNIRLAVVLGDSLSKYGVSTVFADKARFAQIVTNLCSNAIRFTDLVQGERSIIITVNVSPSAPAEGSPCVPPEREPSPNMLTSQQMFLYVSVADSGPGVHPDDVALLFKRFQQGTNSHEVFGGSGLGLFVSRQLTTLMGGRIDVSSEIGNGATFRIKALRRPSGIKDPRHVGVHILITEDNQINQSVLNRQLTKAGCITTLASNGLEAIERICSLAQHGDSRLAASHNSFDVILMDLEMPVMDGLTAVQEIRRMESSGTLPRRNLVVAITGNAREGHKQSALDAGMDMVFVKPYKIDEILEQIASVRA
ncbi:protein-histidine kinase [Ceratobasidium sp. AG-Ba]|nr:protein-histidine kinase [Ceratobasidium sp. AG-Ba]